MKYEENPSSEYRADTCRRTDMTWQSWQALKKGTTNLFVLFTVCGFGRFVSVEVALRKQDLRDFLLPFQCISFTSREIWLDVVQQVFWRRCLFRSPVVWGRISYDVLRPPHKKKSGADKSGQGAESGGKSSCERSMPVSVDVVTSFCFSLVSFCWPYARLMCTPWWYMSRWDIASPILNLDTRLEVSLTRRPLHPRLKILYPLSMGLGGPRCPSERFRWERKYLCPCRETNSDSSDVQSVI